MPPLNAHVGKTHTHPIRSIVEIFSDPNHLNAFALIALLMAGARELDWGELVGMYAMALGATLSVFSWLAAAGMRQPSEARAGMLGIGVIVAWFLLIVIAEAVRTETSSISRLENWVAACSPLGFVVLKDQPVPVPAVIGAQLASMALLWTWSTRRIGKSGKVVA
jgi:hypothetical protein